MKMFFLVVLFPPLLFAMDPVPDSTLKIKKTDSILVQSSPPKKHHFNVKAPNEIREMGKVYKPSSLSREKLEFQIPTLKTDPKPRKMEAHLFVCDETEKYCVPQRISFDVKD